MSNTESYHWTADHIKTEIVTVERYEIFDLLGNSLGLFYSKEEARVALEQYEDTLG